MGGALSDNKPNRAMNTDKIRIHYSLPAKESISPHPGANWTRFVLISDTHSRIRYRVPEGDVLIHAGDLSDWGKPRNLQPTADWLCSLKHPKKIIIAGNHDLCLDPACVNKGVKNRWCNAPTEQDHREGRELFLGQNAKISGIVYLQHASLDLELKNGRRWKVFGSPCSPLFSGGAFQYSRGRDAENLWGEIPIDTEILITHTPPYGILDETRSGVNAGCEALAGRLTDLEALKLLVCGHIHEAVGHRLLTRANDKAAVVNAAAPRSTSPIYVVDIHN